MLLPHGARLGNLGGRELLRVFELLVALREKLGELALQRRNERVAISEAARKEARAPSRYGGSRRVTVRRSDSHAAQLRVQLIGSGELVLELLQRDFERKARIALALRIRLDSLERVAQVVALRLQGLDVNELRPERRKVGLVRRDRPDGGSVLLVRSSQLLLQLVKLCSKLAFKRRNA